MKQTRSWRFFSLIATSTLAFIFVATNVYRLQIGQFEQYSKQALASTSGLNFLSATRGTIYVQDKDGSPVPAALTKDSPVVFAVPAEIEDAGAVASLLSEFVELDSEQLLTMLSRTESQYALLIPRASEEVAEKIEQLNIQGVYVDSEKRRFYPYGDLASQVLGFVGLTAESDVPEGRAGVEMFENDALAGVARSYSEDGGLSDSIDGEDVELTINRDIQAKAEEVLHRLVSEYNAEGGSVIVQDPKTGAILAMANNPTFDPNDYGKYDIGSLSNSSVEDIYEPGSIAKVLTMAAGLDSGALSPGTVYHDTGEIKLNGRTIKNWDLIGHGDVTMTNAIEKSINTALVFAEQQIGHEKFYQYLLDFGFKERTGIKLPNEGVGSLAPLEDVGRDVNFATAAFGQGIAVTPIRLITAISGLANDGVMMKPYIFANQSPQVERQIVSKKAADQVTDMMVSAVDKSHVAAIENYTVAGKTGTAQVPDFVHGGYLDFDEAVINTYIGFAPASDPAFTVMVKLNKPAGAPLAGQTVVPAFREIAEFLLNYLSVPPDDLD
ncbi:MAG: penicillin-binding protein 2 [Candidatus Paceibacterota bacterium]